MNLSFRQATDDDRDYLFRLKDASVRPYVEQTYGPWDEARQRRLFEEHIRPWATRIVLVDGREAGMMEILPEDAGSPRVHLANIWLAPEYHGRGIGTRLVTDLVREAHARGVSVTLNVFKVNPARRLYERLGFVVIGETATQYQMACHPPA